MATVEHGKNRWHLIILVMSESASKCRLSDPLYWISFQSSSSDCHPQYRTTTIQSDSPVSRTSPQTIPRKAEAKKINARKRWYLYALLISSLVWSQLVPVGIIIYFGEKKAKIEGDDERRGVSRFVLFTELFEFIREHVVGRRRSRCWATAMRCRIQIQWSTRDHRCICASGFCIAWCTADRGDTVGYGTMMFDQQWWCCRQRYLSSRGRLVLPLSLSTNRC